MARSNAPQTSHHWHPASAASAPDGQPLRLLAMPLLLISSLLLATGLWQLQLLPAALGLIGCAAASLLQRHAARPARAHLLG